MRRGGEGCEEGSRLIGGTHRSQTGEGCAALGNEEHSVRRVMGKVRARCYRTDGLGRAWKGTAGAETEPFGKHPGQHPVSCPRPQWGMEATASPLMRCMGVSLPGPRFPHICILKVRGFPSHFPSLCQNIIFSPMACPN